MLKGCRSTRQLPHKLYAQNLFFSKTTAIISDSEQKAYLLRQNNLQNFQAAFFKFPAQFFNGKMLQPIKYFHAAIFCKNRILVKCDTIYFIFKNNHRSIIMVSIVLEQGIFFHYNVFYPILIILLFWSGR